MRRVSVLMLIGFLCFACSGKKGTDAGTDATFSVSTRSLELSGVETAVWSITGNLTLTNLASDSIKVYLVETCAWMTPNRTTVELGTGDTAQVKIDVSMKSLLEGHHSDTLTIIDYGTDGTIEFVIVNVNATADSTVAEFVQPTASAIYVGEYSGYYCYQLGSAWFIKCHSNSGNPVKVFAYEVWSAGKLAEETFPEKVVAPGDSLEGVIGFDGCVTVPPPLNAWWNIKVGYRVGTEVRWITHMY